MRILGVDVIAYLTSCCIVMSLMIALIYTQSQDIVLGIELGLVASALSFFIIAFIEYNK